MLILTMHIGDEIMIDTPAGQIRLLVGGPGQARRKLGIDAPIAFRISRSRAGSTSSMPTAPKPSAPQASGTVTRGG